ncbi:MAG: ferredoxin family protein [Actinobacteria bacterium]|nr:ferredoxin family protein [Actinomycetota bacterium]
MIELVVEERCIKCEMCVRVCPTDVFEESESGLPVIARQGDCQTCFLCEVYCPVDALFVAPHATPDPDPRWRDAAWLEQSGRLGSYRRAVGWGRGLVPGASKDASFRLIGLLEATGRLSDADDPLRAAAVHDDAPEAATIGGGR